MEENFDDKIKLMKQELKLYGDDIVKHISSLHSNLLDERISLKTDPKAMVQLLQQDVLTLIKQSESHVQNSVKNELEIEECKKLMNILILVSTISELIAQCDEMINNNDLLLTNKYLSMLQSNIDSLPSSSNSDIGNGKICKLLKRENSILQSRFKSRLKRLLRNCVSVDVGKVAIIKKLQGSVPDEEQVLTEPIELPIIWTAIIQADIADECINVIIQEIWQKVLAPLWKIKKLPFPHVTRTENTCELGYDTFAKENILGASNDGHRIAGGGASKLDTSTVVVKDYSSAPLGASRMAFPQLLEHISTIISFVWSELFVSDEISSRAANSTSSAPVDLPRRLAETLAELIPKSESELTAFQRLVQDPCEEFETRMTGYGFECYRQSQELLQAAAAVGSSEDLNSSTLSVDGNDSTTADSSDSAGIAAGSSLLAILSSLRSRFAKTKRREILLRAREVVLADYHNTMLAAGDALEDEASSAGDIGDLRAVLDQSSSLAMQTLRFEPCHVSLAAHRVLKTVHDAFKQASGATPEMAHILYQSGRDALELFLAIVPIKFADIIETVPHMGAVFYNDCCYIAHNTTLITHAYRKSFAAVDETFQNCVGLMDFVPRFRSLGESKLGKHLDEQKQTLNELVLRINIRTDEESGMTSNNSGDQNMTSGLSVEKDSMAKAVSALTSLPPTSTRAIALTESLRFMDSLSVVGGLRKVVTSVAAAAAGAVFDDGDSAVSSNYTSASKRQYGSHDENFNNEESAAMVIKHIERVSTQWKGVLQQSVYERVVGHLVEYTLRAIMKPVLTADCISETSGAEISRVMKVTLAVSKVFSETDQVGSNNKSVTNKAAAAAEQKCQQVCASWKKFGALSDLLEYSLSEIADQLPLRKFSAFTGHEMCRLIKALFEDTPRRQTILNSIMDMAS